MQYGTACVNNMWAKTATERLTNAVFGLSGETGEIADWFKKHWYHPSKKMELKDLRAEIGDTLWYLAALNELVFGDSLTAVAQENIRKLQARWPDLYTDVNAEELTL